MKCLNIKHLEFTATPIEKLNYLSSKLGVNLYVKRDDLFSKAGGGSKARMLQYILHKALEEKSSYIVTAGGPFSNFNRALALMCGGLDIRMKLVLYNKNTYLEQGSLNKKICDYCGVEYVNCNPDAVPETIEIEIRKLVKSGEKPFYIWGGGKSNEGVYAYYHCVEEIRNGIGIMPDYIFTALGTGTTFSGLTLGCMEYLPHTKVIGISVARQKASAAKVIYDILNEFQSMHETKVVSINIEDNIFDDFLFGGYGKVNNECLNFVKECVINESMIFDSFYVGKALFGLSKLVSTNELFKNKNILFMNTGGLFNF